MVRQHSHLPVQRPGDIIDLKRLLVRRVVVADKEEPPFLYILVMVIIHIDHHLQLVLAVTLFRDIAGDGIEPAQAVALEGRFCLVEKNGFQSGSPPTILV